MIKKIKIKDCKKFLKLFNNNQTKEIWEKIKLDFHEYEWESAELHVDGINNFYILFKNFKKKMAP